MSVAWKQIEYQSQASDQNSDPPPDSLGLPERLDMPLIDHPGCGIAGGRI